MPVVRTVLPTVWGWIADHHGHRRALIRLTSVAATLVCAGLLLATSFGWLFAVLLLLNVFWCAALPLVEATTFGLLKGRLGDYGRIRVWGSVSFVLAVLAIGPVLDWAGILGCRCAGGVVRAVAAAAWLLPADEAARTTRSMPLGRILRRPEVVALFVACFLMSLAHGPYNSFYSIHLVDLGYSKTAVSWLWTISVVAEIGVFLWMPHLLRRVSIANVIALSLGCAVVRFLLIGWLAQRRLLIALAQVLHAATFGAHHAAALAAIHHFFRGRFQARGQGLYTAWLRRRRGRRRAAAAGCGTTSARGSRSPSARLPPWWRSSSWSGGCAWLPLPTLPPDPRSTLCAGCRARPYSARERCAIIH